MWWLQLSLDGLLQAGPYALVGLGLTLSFGVLRRINLAFGAGAMSGAYVGSWLYSMWDGPVGLVFAVVVLVTSAVGWYVQRLCFHDAIATSSASERGHFNGAELNNREVVALVATFAVWMQLEQISVNWMPSHLHPFPDWSSHHEWSWGPLGVRPDRLWVCVGDVLLVLGLQRWIQWSPTGLALRATVSHTLAAQLSGMRVARLQAVGLILASAISGVATCAVLAMDGQVTPMFGMWMLMKGLTVAMLGGLGNLRGVLLGAVLLGCVEAHAQAWFGALGRDAACWGLLLLALLLKTRSGTQRGALHA
jgi:branched-subunit amino acid ABC-type transport system permease component